MNELRANSCAVVASLLAARRRRRQAPEAFAVEGSKLGWLWQGREPYRWNIWFTLDGGATWDHPEDYWTTGDDREFWPDGGSYPHLVVGVDAAGNEVTRRSNAVTPDDALPPMGLLSDLVAYWKLDEVSGRRLDAHGDADLKEVRPVEEEGEVEFVGLIPSVTGARGLGAVMPWEYENSNLQTVDGSVVVPLNSDFTLALWLWKDDWTTGYCHMLSAGLGFMLHGPAGDDGLRVLFMGPGYTPTQELGVEAENLSNGNFNHVVVTRSGTTLGVYVNGAAMMAPVTLTVGEVAVDSPLRLGCSFWGYGYGTAAYDEVGVWSRALSPAEVAALYNGGLGLAYEDF